MTTWGSAIAGWVEIPIDWRMEVLGVAEVEWRTELTDESSGCQLSAGSGCVFIPAWQHALVNILDGMVAAKMPAVFQYVRRNGIESMQEVHSAYTIGGAEALLAMIGGDDGQGQGQAQEEAEANRTTRAACDASQSRPVTVRSGIDGQGA